MRQWTGQGLTALLSPSGKSATESLSLNCTNAEKPNLIATGEATGGEETTSSAHHEVGALGTAGLTGNLSLA